MKLAINQCPNHGYYSISIDKESSGTRLTNGKCCGRWKVIKEWEMTVKELRKIIIKLEYAIDDIERNEK